MGFSDIGCYGGEIRTPHLDRLAAEGIRFTQFYNVARAFAVDAKIGYRIRPGMMLSLAGENLTNASGASLSPIPSDRRLRAGMAITLAAAKIIKDTGLKPRRTIRVVFWGAEEPGIWGGRAYAEAHKAENIVLAAESDFGADRVYRVSSKVAAAGLPLIAEIGRVLAPLGVAPTRDNTAGGGPDIVPLAATGVGILELEQDGSRYFDLHHTPDDTFDKVDKAQLDQNVAAYAAAIWLAASDERPLRTK